MKRIFTALFLLIAGLATGNVQAQQVYGNEWIDYSKTYYKLQVVETGIYKLDYTYLSNLGLQNVNPQHLQLFRRGKEVAIYVAGEQDGRLDAQDFVEFYGERNDGALDKELYKDPSHQVHQLSSIYTDTAAYFLTVNPAGGNKRMRELNPSVDGKSPEPYHLQKALLVRTETQQLGSNAGSARLPWMDEGEGYFSAARTTAQNFDITGVTNVEATGPQPQLSVATVGPTSKLNRVDINLVNSTTRNLLTANYAPFSFSRHHVAIAFSDLNISQSKLTVQLQPQDAGGGAGSIALAYAMLTFPQKGVYSGKSMFIYTDSTRSSSPYFEFTGAAETVYAYDVTDQQQIIRTIGRTIGTKRGFAFNTGSAEHKILLANTAQALVPVGSTKKINFRNIRPESADYLVISNRLLMQVAGDGALPAPEAYAAYRASAAGGGYNTLLVFTDELVNQFHYGEHSGNAIRRFADYMYEPSRQKFLFIIGKGYEVRYLTYKSAASRVRDLVPTGLGVHPASDLLFSTDYRNGNLQPRFATGRLSVTTAAEVMAYLDKVKTHEALKDGLPWRKNVLHLGGGKTQSEIKSITDYIKSYTSIIEGPLLGASVEERTRQNLSDVTETLDVSKEINDGISLLTFFGHSAPGTTDLDIGKVTSPFSKYNNEGKYPVMLMNGCNAGNCFASATPSFGEDWLSASKKGALALVAHVEAGIPTYLNLYTTYFYRAGFQREDFYGKTLGEVQLETIRNVGQTISNDLAVTMNLEMVLQGDPAIKLYNPSKPDYTFTGNKLVVTDATGEVATAESSKLTLKVDVGNLGKAIETEVEVRVKRTLADNKTVLEETLLVEPIIRGRELLLEINNTGMAAAGLNAFEITLDSGRNIDELNEDNNTFQYSYFIPATGLAALAPAPYGIVGDKRVKLVTQASGAAEKQKVYFELDTTAHFNSSSKLKALVDNATVSVWEVDLPAALPDSTVYFWRARFNEFAENEDTVWVQSSFRYIPQAQNGWSQSHKQQFAEAVTDGFEAVTEEGDAWNYNPVRRFVSLKTRGGNLRFVEEPYGVYLDGAQQMSYFCGNPQGSSASRIFFMVFDPITLEPVSQVGSFTACSFRPVFDTGNLSTASNQAKIAALINSVPAGYYVALMGMNNVPFTTLPEEAKAAIRSLGSSLINNLKTGEPFALVGIKGGAAGTAQEVTAIADSEVPAANQDIHLEGIITSRKAAGTITSTVIGPALKWASLHHNIEKYESGEDVYKLSLIGISALGDEVVLQEEVTEKVFDISHIDAAEYPSLRLSAYLQDETARTAPQLKQWFILYEGVPEGIVRPDLVKASSEELTQQANRGSVTLPMAFQNVSSTAFSDSLTVEVTLTGNGIQETTNSFKIKPVAANETVFFNYTFPTQALDGEYKLSLYVNPRILPEQEYFNNVYEVSFNVQSKLHPIMDVAFDGVHILDGDLVSPSPLISVTVKDENKHVFLQDPSNMTLILKTPTEDGREIELMNNPEVIYTPATDKNDFKLEYKPQQLENGTHLLEVRAKDAAGKESGAVPYRITFNVENESSITNFYPFPNPFSTKTNFIFTLAGSKVPDNLKIQILTISGKVVKEIMKEELGPLRIGNNKTEYAWDGTDMYGDRLANGVYLYRVLIDNGGEEMRHRNTFGDGAFKNGYGKLYILR